MLGGLCVALRLIVFSLRHGTGLGNVLMLMFYVLAKMARWSGIAIAVYQSAALGVAARSAEPSIKEEGGAAQPLFGVAAVFV